MSEVKSHELKRTFHQQQELESVSQLDASALANYQENRHQADHDAHGVDGQELVDSAETLPKDQASGPPASTSAASSAVKKPRVKLSAAEKEERQREKEAKAAARADAKAKREREQELKQGDVLKRKLAAAIKKSFEYTKRCKFAYETCAGVLEGVSLQQMVLAFRQLIAENQIDDNCQRIEISIGLADVKMVLGGRIEKPLYYGDSLGLLSPLNLVWNAASSELHFRSQYGMMKKNDPYMLSINPFRLL